MSEKTPETGAHSMGELKDAALDGARWIAFTRAGSEVVLVAAMVVLARLISPAAFGEFAVALVFQELALAISGEGFGTPLVQRKVVTPAHEQAALFLSLVVGAALGVLVLVLAPLVITPLFGSSTTELVAISTPMFVIGGLAAVPQALIQRRLDFRFISVVRIVSTLARAIATVALALAGLDAQALVLGGVVAAAVTAVLMMVKAPPRLPVPRVQPMKDIASFGMHSAVAGLSWTAFRNADFTIVAARLGTTVAGYYWRAFQMALEYQRKVSAVMMEIAFPIYSRASTIEEMFAIRRRMVCIAAITIYPMLAGLAVLAPSLIPWLFGPAWEPCVTPTQILTIAGMATLLTDAMGAVLFAAGRPRMLVGYNLAYFATYALAVFFATPFGLNGVCVAVVAVYLVYTVIAYGVLLRGLVEKPLGRIWGDIAPALVSSAALVGVGLPLAWVLRRAGTPVPIEALGVGAVAGAAYLLTLQQLFPAGWSDLLLLARRILRRRRKATLGEVPIASEALAR